MPIADASLKNRAVFFLARHLLIAALMVSIGGQWMIVQSVAWVGMAVKYSAEEGSVVEGLSKTFDGEHPCPLCKAVDEGQKQEKKQEKKEAGGKLELFFTHTVVSLFPPAAGEFPRADDETAVAQAIEPRVPPPRCGAI